MSFLVKTKTQYSLDDLNKELDKLIATNSFVKESNRSSAYPSILNITAPKKGLILGRTSSIEHKFHGTIFEEIFKKHSPLGNLQIRLLNPEGTYTAHKDPDFRSHIAIRTNPQCVITNFDSYETMHVPANGFVYDLDARCVHTAVNCGTTPRYHVLWSHYRCENESQTPFRVAISVETTNGSIFSWQQAYLIDLVIEYETSIQECVMENISQKFSSRVYNISFVNRGVGKDFLAKLSGLLSKAPANFKVVLNETP